MSATTAEDIKYSFFQCIKTIEDYSKLSSKVIESYFEGNKSKRITKLLILIEETLNDEKSYPINKFLALVLFRDMLMKTSNKIPKRIAKQKNLLQRLYDISVSNKNNSKQLGEQSNSSDSTFQVSKCAQLASECICFLKSKFGEGASNSAEVFRRLYRRLSKTATELPHQLDFYNTIGDNELTASFGNRTQQIFDQLSIRLSNLGDIKKESRAAIKFDDDEEKNNLEHRRKKAQEFNRVKELFENYQREKTDKADSLLSITVNSEEFVFKVKQALSDLYPEITKIISEINLLKAYEEQSVEEKKFLDDIEQERKLLSDIQNYLQKESSKVPIPELLEKVGALFGKKFKIEEKTGPQILSLQLPSLNGHDTFSSPDLMPIDISDRQKQTTGVSTLKESSDSKKSPDTATQRGAKTPVFKVFFNDSFTAHIDSLHIPDTLTENPANDFKKLSNLASTKGKNTPKNQYDPQISEQSIRRLLKTDKDVFKDLEKIQKGIISSLQQRKKSVPWKAFENFEHTKQQYYSSSSKNSNLSDSNVASEKINSKKFNESFSKITSERKSGKSLSYPIYTNEYYIQRQPNPSISKIRSLNAEDEYFLQGKHVYRENSETEKKDYERSSSNIAYKTQVLAYGTQNISVNTAFRNTISNVDMPLPKHKLSDAMNNFSGTQHDSLNKQISNKQIKIKSTKIFKLNDSEPFNPLRRKTRAESYNRTKLKDGYRKPSVALNFNQESNYSSALSHNQNLSRAASSSRVLYESSIRKDPKFPTTNRESLVSPFNTDSKPRIEKDIKIIEDSELLSELVESHLSGLKSIEQYRKIACVKQGSLHDDKYLNISASYSTAIDQNKEQRYLQVVLLIGNKTTFEMNHFRITFLTDPYLEYVKLPNKTDPSIAPQKQIRIEFFISVTKLPFTYLPLKCGMSIVEPDKIEDLSIEFILPVSYNMFMSFRRMITNEEFFSVWHAPGLILRTKPSIVTNSLIKVPEDFSSLLGELLVKTKLGDGSGKPTAYSLIGKFSLEWEHDEYLIKIIWIPKNNGIIFEVACTEQTSGQAEFILQTLQFLFCNKNCT